MVAPTVCSAEVRATFDKPECGLAARCLGSTATTFGREPIAPLSRWNSPLGLVAPPLAERDVLRLQPTPSRASMKGWVPICCSDARPSRRYSGCGGDSATRRPSRVVGARGRGRRASAENADSVPLLGLVVQEEPRELLRPARRAGARYDLVRDDAQPLVYDVPLEFEREEAIARSDDASRWHVRPPLQRPRGRVGPTGSVVVAEAATVTGECEGRLMGEGCGGVPTGGRRRAGRCSTTTGPASSRGMGATSTIWSTGTSVAIIGA